MKEIFIFLFILNVWSIYSQEETEKEEIDMFGFDDEYVNIFKTIPPLFKYVVNILNENPEILERNNTSTFTNDTNNDEKNIKSENLSCCRDVDTALDGEDEDGVRKLIQISKTFLAPVTSTFYLTPEAVMEQVLIVEQKLDEYNRKSSK